MPSPISGASGSRWAGAARDAATAVLVLGAYGVGERKFAGQLLTIEKACAAAGQHDRRHLFVGGAPVPALVDLAQRRPCGCCRWPATKPRRYAARTVPHRRRHPREQLRQQFGGRDVGIGTYWLVLAELDDNLVH